MERSISEYIQMCQWDHTRFLIISDNVFGNLIYYSHLLPLVISLLIAIFVFSKNYKFLAAKLFFGIVVILSIWLYSDLVLWATEKPSYTMFFWSLLVLIEPMIYAGMLFFLYAFIDGKGASFRTKLIIFLLLLPTVILIPTNFALTHYDLTNCNREAIEGPLAFYGYIVEIIISLWILILGMNKFIKFKERLEKKKVILITIGAVFFLLSFAIGNVIGSLLVDWQIGQIGLLSIPVFIAVLSYLIVKYQAFNIKLIATQVLITGIWVLTLAILFIRRIENVRAVVLITLFLFTILGYLLIKSVKREVSLREQLQVANEGQANLLHIINHQIKGYLSKSRNIFSELLTEPSYNACTDEARPLLNEGFTSLTDGVNFVQNFLNASNIDRGVFTYNMVPADFKKIVTDIAETQKSAIQEKGLAFELNVAEGDYGITGDIIQLGQAVRNLLDNAMHYTLQGSVWAKLERVGDKVVFSVKDTGVGLSDEVKPKLFTKGGRDKDSQKININSTGFGLAFVKGVAEAHKGRVWAESEGPGKGSTFYLELPVK